MFQIKVCGIKDLGTAEACVRLGVSAIGLNFYSKSKRFVSNRAASQISAGVRGKISVVGLFVNHTLDQVAEIASEVGLDFLQLHGDEAPTFIQDLDANPTLKNVKVIRAIRIGPQNESDAVTEMKAWTTMDRSGRLAGFILDTFQPGQFGGTGKTIDWNWLSSIELKTDLPIILAGGLEPQNVSKAIEMVQPSGVDVAGGVENDNQEKDPAQIESFVTNVNLAFSKLKTK